MKQKYTDIIKKKFNSEGQWGLVIGDVMLDKYIFGEVARISPEAPVPILEKKSESYRMGGAANVAANLAGLGIKTYLCGVVGGDHNAELLKNLLKNKSVNYQGLIKSKAITTTKTRIIGGQQQIVRIDEEDACPQLSSSDIKKIIDLISRKPSIIILSDYAKGLLNPNLTQKIIKLANKLNIQVLVDPKGNDIEKYAGATILTPNKKEALELTSGNIESDALLDKRLKLLCTKYKLQYIAMTQGSQGIKLIGPQKSCVIPATELKQVFDVSGAGDTVIATLAAGLIGKMTVHDALELANIAAGIAITKVGTVPVEAHEIVREIEIEHSQQINKIIKPDQLESYLSSLRSAGLKIGFTNGCFDILHAGHVSYLEQAKRKVDHLILGLNSDSSVKKLKGAGRPLVNQDDRARVLCSLESIDTIVIFNENTPIKLIQIIKPDILMKGSDYQTHEVVGNKEVKKWGGKVELVELLAGRSSSKIIKKMT